MPRSTKRKVNTSDDTKRHSFNLMQSPTSSPATRATRSTIKRKSERLSNAMPEDCELMKTPSLKIMKPRNVVEMRASKRRDSKPLSVLMAPFIAKIQADLERGTGTKQIPKTPILQAHNTDWNGLISTLHAGEEPPPRSSKNINVLSNVTVKKRYSQQSHKRNGSVSTSCHGEPSPSDQIFSDISVKQAKEKPTKNAGKKIVVISNLTVRRRYSQRLKENGKLSPMPAKH